MSQERALDSLPNSNRAPEPADRRQFERAPVADDRIEVRYKSGISFAKNFISDISSGGMMIKSEHKPEIGSRLEIHFSVPTQDGSAEVEEFDIRAKVVRHTATGLGLEFLKIDQKTRQRIDLIVQQLIKENGGKNLSTARAHFDDSAARLQEARQKREEELRSKRILGIKWGLVCLLLLANLFFGGLGFFRNSELSTPEVERTLNQSNIPESVRVRVNPQTRSTSIETSAGAILSDASVNRLPVPLRITINGARQMPTEKKRTSKTASSSLVELR